MKGTGLNQRVGLNKKSLIILCIAIVAVVLMIVLIVINNPKVGKSPDDEGTVGVDSGLSEVIVKDDTESTVDGKEEGENTDTVEDIDTPVVSQEDVAVKDIGVVKGVQDNLSSIMYTVKVGIEDAAKDVTVKATGSTLFYDNTKKRIVSLQGVTKGVDVALFTVGTAGQENMEARAVVIGDNLNTVKYGRLKEVYKENDKEYIGVLATGEEKIKITANTEIKNGYTDVGMDIGRIEPNAEIFYYVGSSNNALLDTPQELSMLVVVNEN